MSIHWRSVCMIEQMNMKSVAFNRTFFKSSPAPIREARLHVLEHLCAESPNGPAWILQKQMMNGRAARVLDHVLRCELMCCTVHYLHQPAQKLFGLCLCLLWMNRPGWVPFFFLSTEGTFRRTPHSSYSSPPCCCRSETFHPPEAGGQTRAVQVSKEDVKPPSNYCSELFYLFMYLFPPPGTLKLL